MTTKYERLIRRIRQDPRLWDDDIWMVRAHHVMGPSEAPGEAGPQ